jgi:hypothetical protein
MNDGRDGTRRVPRTIAKRRHDVLWRIREFIRLRQRRRGTITFDCCGDHSGCVSRMSVALHYDDGAEP